MACYTSAGGLSGGFDGILDASDARRFLVLASFSLRSAAHVHEYAPLRCSRKPRQNAELGGRAFFGRLATGDL